MRRKKISGSITIFVAMVMLLVASLLFTMLESARVSGLRAKADMNGMLSVESLFAEYNPELLDMYDLFYLDMGYGQGKMSANKVQERILELNQENLDPEQDGVSKTYANLYRMKVTQCVIEGYELATDYAGNAFYEQAVESMENEMPFLASEKIYQFILDTKNTEESCADIEQNVDAAKNSISTAKSQKEEEDRKKKERNEPVEPLEPVEDPVEFVASLKTNGILSQVIRNPQDLSTKAVDLSDALENRLIDVGTYGGNYQKDIYKTVVFQTYLKEHFGCFTDQKENRVLNYELEYLLAGKESDKDNLENVVYRLLAIREAANLIYLIRDPEKMNEASAIATALVGFTGNPAAIELVKAGVLAAWSYVESIMDIRTLLEGGKIPLIKTNKDWVTDIRHISESYGKTQRSPEDSNGFSYIDYLQKFFFFSNQKELNYRCLSEMERNIRLVSNNQNLRMDAMAQKMKVQIQYESAPLFFRFVTIGNIIDDTYMMQRQEQFTYLKQKR